MNGKLKTALHLIGAALGFAGLGFLIYALEWGTVLDSLNKLGMFTFAAASLIYGFALFLLSVAWIIYLRNDQTKTIPFRRLNAVYARSVLTKYIPSGLFQYASRQVDALHLGIAQKFAAKASVGEIISQIAATLFLTAIALFISGGELPFITKYDLQFLPIALIGLTLCGLAGLLRLYPLKQAAGPYVCHLLFFLVSALVSSFIALQVLNVSVSLTMLVAVFTLAWLAGFVVIGASGGIGVREACLIFLLAGICPAEEAASIALLTRLVTIAGDMLFAVCGTLSPRISIAGKK